MISYINRILRKERWFHDLAKSIEQTCSPYTCSQRL